jgi:ABC-type lipoprotein export system ATPase subunit
VTSSPWSDRQAPASRRCCPAWPDWTNPTAARSGSADSASATNPRRPGPGCEPAESALLLQSGNLFTHVTVAQNVRIARQLATATSSTTTVDLLTALGIAARAGARPDELSGGELARAGLAVALANDPVVLLADEPTGELDGATEAQILRLLRSRADSGVAILIASHSPAVAAASDRVLTLIDGSVVDPKAAA